MSIKHLLARLYYAFRRLLVTQPPTHGFGEHRQNETPASLLNTLYLRDDQLSLINEQLDWHAFTVDGRGRRIGRIHNHLKRGEPQPIRDRRIDLLASHINLRDAKVHEYGCFEGIHSLALLEKGAHLTGVDARPINLAKTSLRISLYGQHAQLLLADLDDLSQLQVLTDAGRLQCDVLVHIGVLYHLANPVEHLRTVLPSVGNALLIDTHVSTTGETTKTEFGIRDPFSGTGVTSKWITQESIGKVCLEAGFRSRLHSELREERNGLRLFEIWTKQ